MLSIAASTRVKSPDGSLSSCFCALLARLTLQPCRALGSVLRIGDRFTGSRFGAAAFDGAKLRCRRRGFGDGLVGELLRPNDDGAALPYNRCIRQFACVRGYGTGVGVRQSARGASPMLQQDSVAFPGGLVCARCGAGHGGSGAGGVRLRSCPLEPRGELQAQGFDRVVVGLDVHGRFESEHHTRESSTDWRGSGSCRITAGARVWRAQPLRSSSWARWMSIALRCATSRSSGPRSATRSGW